MVVAYFAVSWKRRIFGSSGDTRNVYSLLEVSAVTVELSSSFP
jgi:hypothetical protein